MDTMRIAPDSTDRNEPGTTHQSSATPSTVTPSSTSRSLAQAESSRCSPPV